VADWNPADQLSLLESALAVGGFGAGGVVLYATIRQLGATLGRSEISLEPAPEGQMLATTSDYVSVGNPGHVAFRCAPAIQLTLRNTAEAVATTWQAEVQIPEPFIVADVENDSGVTISPERRLVMFVGNAPLFVKTPRRLSPITLAISLSEDRAASSESHRGEPVELRVTVTTEHGHSTAGYQVMFKG
jgi:hypothetical protein